MWRTDEYKIRRLKSKIITYLDEQDRKIAEQKNMLTNQIARYKSNIAKIEDCKKAVTAHRAEAILEREQDKWHQGLDVAARLSPGQTLADILEG